jgi:hypothetical protein
MERRKGREEEEVGELSYVKKREAKMRRLIWEKYESLVAQLVRALH